MYEEDRARVLLTKLHWLLSLFHTAYNEVLLEEITATLVEMQVAGEIQIVGPDTYQAAPSSAARLSPFVRHRRAAIQRLWNVEVYTTGEIADKLGLRYYEVEKELARMRSAGWCMLKHKRGGGHSRRGRLAEPWPTAG